jgi:hypothetical protein
MHARHCFWRIDMLATVDAMKFWHIILENVKEHATLSARARVDHGVGVKTTEDHVNRAADRGCCVSTCSAIFSAMSTGPVSTPWKNH